VTQRPSGAPDVGAPTKWGIAESIRRLALPATIQLNAVVDVIPDPRRIAGGPLDGLPIAIKNMVDVEGVPTRCGSGAPTAPASADASVVARLRNAGAAIVATTQCLEWAVGVNPSIGDTRNPRDAARTSGGSSGGSAAVVAAGVVPVALGTDTGGSVRIPAAYCGVAGVKATTGWVPLDGVQPVSPTLDAVGFFAATVAELWPPLAVAAGVDPSPHPRANPTPTLGVLEHQFADGCLSRSTASRFQAALRALSEQGIRLISLRPRWTREYEELQAALYSIIGAEFASTHLGRAPSEYGDVVSEFFAFGRAVSGADLAAARRRRHLLIAEIDQTLDQVDALVGPTVGQEAPHDDTSLTGDTDGEVRFVGPVNLGGHPAVAVPIPAVEDQLPLSLQVIGRRGGDLGLLSVSETVERALNKRIGRECGRRRRH
jgi:aspartyl-tRNA(Asn)/glutamyl-tRNA(Gln) amidotransferase subunit A